MNALSNSARGVLWWVLPLAALVALIGFETDGGRALHKPMAAEVPATPKPVTTALLPDFQVDGGLAARTDTVNRALFNPTRRPAPALVAENARTAMRRGQFALTGTIVVDGKNTAYLRETVAGGKSRRVVQGETINGMVVSQVKPDRVVLALGDETEELVLKVMAGPKTTAQPAPVAVATPVIAAPAAGTAPATAAPAPTQTTTSNPATLAGRRAAARAADAARTGGAAAAPVPGAPAQDGFSEMYRQRYGADAQQAPAAPAAGGRRR
ncbi:MAG: hypothetical protein ABI886_13090 [Betaproteobacteria bacterium]